MRTHTFDSLRAGYHDRDTHPVAGVLAGLIGGLAYLLAQMLFAWAVHDGEGWEPMHRISAILLGTDAATEGESSARVVGMALMIHFALSAVFGRIVDAVVRGQGLAGGAVLGVGVGFVLYLVNYWAIAPVAFPWFAENRGTTTLVDHLLFGAVAGVAYVQLRARLSD